MFQKVFRALISSDMNVNLWFSFSFWSVRFGMSSSEHPLFIYYSLKICFEWWLSLQTSCVFFWICWRFFHTYIMFKTTFFHRNSNWKSTVSKNSFFACHAWNSMKLFSNLQLFVTDQTITCIRHIKLLSLSFITYTFITSSLPLI